MLAGARSRRLRLRNGPIHSRARAAATVQQRFLNHFISKAPSTEPNDASPPSFRLAIKDNIATTHLPTTCASPFLSSYTSPFEATIVTQLLGLGAIPTGKTNLDEFGMGSHSTNSASGPVVSPLSPSPSPSSPNSLHLSAGGSSGGSAAAVASGEADVALGTDTGGSVRLPAAYTGTVGYKPSYGMISRWGVVPYANSLDTVGFLARTAGRIRALVVEGGLYRQHDGRDPTSLSPAARGRCTAAREGYKGGDVMEVRGTTFGIPMEYNIDELDPRIRDAWARIATRLQQAGARVVPVSLPSTRHALSAYYVIAPAEASSNLAKYDGVRYGTRDAAVGRGGSDRAGETLYSDSRGAGFGDEVRRRILLGSYTLSSEAMDNYFIRAQKVRRLVVRDFDRVFGLDNPLRERETFDLADLDEGVELEDKFGPAEVDFLLCPTAPTLPPSLEEVMAQTPVDGYMNDVFTVPASLAGLPAVSVPVKIEGAGGPVDFAGLQVIGQFWDDARVLGVAERIAELGD